MCSGMLEYQLFVSQKGVSQAQAPHGCIQQAPPACCLRCSYKAPPQANPALALLLYRPGPPHSRNNCPALPFGYSLRLPLAPVPLSS